MKIVGMPRKKIVRAPAKTAAQKTAEDLEQKALGERIRELRKSHGWSQEGFADHCGLDRSHMGEVERGAVDPQWTTLTKVIRGLGMKPGEILDVLFEKPLTPAPSPLPTSVPQGGSV